MIEERFRKRTNIEIDKAIYDRLDEYCKEKHYFKHSFVNKVVCENVEEMNEMDVSLRTSNGNEKAKLQLTFDERYYNELKRPKVARIERMIEKILNSSEEEDLK